MTSIWQELKRRNVIRVGALYALAGWVLMQVADILFGLLDVPGWGLRLVLGLLLLGFPLVLIFSWVFELTPEGLKRESEVDRGRSIATATGRKIDRLIIAGLAVLVMVLLAERLAPRPAHEESPQAATPAPAAEPEPAPEEEPAAETGQKSIAVLPFVNMSGDEQNEYFSDGLTEELLNLLAKVEDLRVTSRTSSFAFKGKDTSIPSVARELNVDHILEGSVRKAGTQIRITAQLIDVDTDSHLWSETYDRELDDIFAIQDEIANAVVAALKVRLAGIGAAPEPSPHELSADAYLLYMRGRHIYELGKDTRDADFIRQAMGLYESALAVEPDYALAYAGLADAYGRLAIQEELGMAEGYERSRQMALQALAIDPDLVEALLALADIQLEYDWDLDAAEASYRRALQMRPSDAEALRTYGYFLVTAGRFDEAADYYRRALEVDPLQMRAYGGLMFALLLAGRFDELPDVTERLAQRRDAEFMKRWNHNLELATLRYQRRYAELIELLPEQPETVGDLQDAAIAHFHVGNPTVAEEYLQRLVEIAAERNNEFSDVASALAQLGQSDRAIEYLEMAVAAREVNLPFIRIDPDLEPLHDDPRFLALLERIGLQPPP